MPLRLANAFRSQRSAQYAVLEAVASATEHGVFVAIGCLGEMLALLNAFGEEDGGNGGWHGDGDGGDGAGFGHAGWFDGWLLEGGISAGDGYGEAAEGWGEEFTFACLNE